MLALATLMGGWIRFNLIPDVESDVVTAEVEMLEGTPADVTEQALRYIEERALVLRDELDAGEYAVGTSIFRHSLVSVGDSPDHHDDFKQGGPGPHTGRVSIELAAGHRRAISGFEVEERWRKLVGGIPGAVALRFLGSSYMNDPPIDVRVSSEDAMLLEAAAEVLKERLAAYPGVREISDSLGDGKQEVKLHIRPEAEAFGVTLAELARQVRKGFHGEEVQRIQRGRDDVPVVVRYPSEERRSLGDLENIRIRTPAGGEVPFSAVAVADIGRGYTRIERTGRSRTVNVVADVDPAIASAEDVLVDVRRNVLPEIAAEFARAGIGEEEEELFSSLARSWLLAIIVGYALLATSLRSYAHPVVIFVAIPFGLVGALIGHLVLGLHFSGFSMIGMVALTGVVVNDSLVYVDCANRRRAEGLPLQSALIEAGVLRFRPILMTSLTTFVGLMPLLAEQSTQAQWLKPIVATLAFGVLFATAITLLLVPASYAILEDLRSLARGASRAESDLPQAPAPRPLLRAPALRALED
jgi:multidrug efflux pump subunit AcrB